MKKIYEKNFRALFLNMYIFEVVTFVFSPSAYPINSIFQLSNQFNFSIIQSTQFFRPILIYKIHVFDEAFSLVTIRMLLITNFSAW